MAELVSRSHDTSSGACFDCGMIKGSMSITDIFPHISSLLYSSASGQDEPNRAL